MSFKPIAIVGRGCLFPGANDAKTLTRRILKGEDLVSTTPEGRWGIDAHRILGAGGDHTLQNRGGYVSGFDGTFDPTGYALNSEALQGLDPLFQWVLHTARVALNEAGFTPGDLPRAGAILGNLSFPSEGLSRFAEATWLHEAGYDQKSIQGLLGRSIPGASSRFMSGLPALILGPALGLSVAPYALDAACASALYAVKLACNALQEGKADLMLAGAVNRADDLFIHVGFTALKALSPTGQSRPFHREADGLVPAEGAGILALMTLERAQKEGKEIFGVIRGVGLSNDGRAGGFLAPSSKGQLRSMEAAYRGSGLTPMDIQLAECHATGTSVGDGTEIQSMAALFAGHKGLPIGSLKSNMGHLITAAGVAGMIKVMGAMESGLFPPTLHANNLNPALDNTPFRVLNAAEAWQVKGPRIASVSAFGFGGNNAHLILESPPSGGAVRGPVSVSVPKEEAIAIVSMGARIGDGAHAQSFARALFGMENVSPTAENIQIALKGLRSPPKDLQSTLPQQTLILEAIRKAAGSGITLPRDTTGIYVGMGADPEVARYGARWRSRQWEADLKQPGFEDAAQEGTVPLLESAGVLGTMPNIPANRLNLQLDLAGPSFTVSAEEASGLVAVDIACGALNRGELDAAIVAAVDLCAGPVHASAAKQLLPKDRQAPGDGAIALVLKRLKDAVAAGDNVIAVIEKGHTASAPSDSLKLGLAQGYSNLAPLFGHAHAASGLLHLGAAALCLHHRMAPLGKSLEGIRHAEVRVDPMEGPSHRFGLVGHTSAPKPLLDLPQIFAYRATSQAALISRLNRGEIGGEGTVSAAIVCPPDELENKIQRAIRSLEHNAPPGSGVILKNGFVEGELAFVFTGAGAAYQGMGQSLLAALPELAEDLTHNGFSGLWDALKWSLADTASHGGVFDKLWGSSALSQLHAGFTQNVLGITPHAAIGYSSGETNALFALNVWSDLDAMVSDSHDSGIFDEKIGGNFDSVKAEWNQSEVNWALYTIMAPIEDIRARIKGEKQVHLAIIHHGSEAIIAGDEKRCKAIALSFGAGRFHRLNYPLAVHVPELQNISTEWLALHRRNSKPVPAVRFYSNGVAKAYHPTSETAAQAILDQGITTLDFPKTINTAYDDGIRIFVEHGPQGAASQWIRKILGERASHCLIVALDKKGQGLTPLLAAAAELWAVGHPIDLQKLNHRLQPHISSQSGPNLTLPAHMPPVTLMGPTQKDNTTMGATHAADLKGKQAVKNQGDYALAHPPELAPIHHEIPYYGSPHEDNTSPMKMQPPPVLVAQNTTDSAPTGDDIVNKMPSIKPGFQGQPAFAPVSTPMPQPYAPASISQASMAQQPAQAMQQPMVHPQMPVASLAGYDLGQLHANFLRNQAQVHRAFLESRQRMVMQLANLSQGHMQPAPFMQQPMAAQPVQARPAPPAIQMPITPLIPAAMPKAPTPPSAASVASPKAPVALTPEVLPGLKLNRAQLEVHSSGKISEIYGAQFEPQDDYHRQVRMPEPPLLLADRVTGMDAVPGSMKKGTIWTETDVTEDAWYLHDGHMPAGIMIESGQADLMLISYLGIDLFNKGDRVYRLLGCDLTYHQSLPSPGETLAYDIHVDGHAQQGDIRLFFFHYDCHVHGEKRLSVREGQAGFFTDQELDDSEGCIWSAEEETPCPNPRLDKADVLTQKTAFTTDEIKSFAEGRVWETFGPEFDFGKTHVCSPRIAGGRMLFLETIPEFDPKGGPWGRGYLKAETHIHPDDWYFEGHFKNDPCMPGTLMFEGCLQTMAFYLSALGYTLQKDGWRFEPVKEKTFPLLCRGQVTPTSKKITYEVFVQEVISGPTPTLYADLLCTVDGLKAFLAKGVGLELVPDWPISRLPKLLKGYVEPKPVAEADGFVFDYKSLMACAWGRPSEAFGPMYEMFDGHRRVARLPGPPYHFMSRVSHIDGQIGAVVPGATIEIEYDIPPDAWYYNENGCNAMPYCVLLEAILQPCGWLASFVGSAASVDEDLSFRNLDGKGTVLADLPPDTGTIRTVVNITSVSKTAGMIIESFDVNCYAGDTKVYELQTVFGFFPKVALENQVGLPTTPEQRAFLEGDNDYFVDLTTRPTPYCGGSISLAEPMLLMIDRVTGYWPTGGEAGLGRLRAEKDVRQEEWFFKAHFFQDPVQPGSLGIEAMIQLLQFYMLDTGMAEGISNPRFEGIATGKSMSWKYRGQVIPSNKVIASTIEITDKGQDEKGAYAICNASLWVDGKRIYEATDLGMRIVPGTEPFLKKKARDEVHFDLDPNVDTWIGHHRPTFTRPALPMMSIVDYLAQGVPGTLKSLQDITLMGWVILEGKSHFFTKVSDDTIRLFQGKGDAAKLVASARFVLGNPDEAPEALSPMEGEVQGDPYASGRLFHGPSFQVMTRWILGQGGASSWLMADGGSLPLGCLNPALLDGATHGIPHDRLERVDSDLSHEKVAYPFSIPELRLFATVPSEGQVRCEMRYLGPWEGSLDRPTFRIQMSQGSRVFLEMVLVESAFPKGPLGMAAPEERRAFLRDGLYTQGLGLSETNDSRSTLRMSNVLGSDWLPGTIEAVYGTKDPRKIAERDAMAAQVGIHPKYLPEALPLTDFHHEVQSEKGTVTVDITQKSTLNLKPIKDYWKAYFNQDTWPVEDLYYGLIERFVRRVVFEDPAGLQALRGRSILYVANHQVASESLLFSIIASGLLGTPTVTVAKAEHRHTWLGRLIKHCFEYPGVKDPEVITFFDRDDKQDLLRIIQNLGLRLASGKRSVMVHIEGTRSLSCQAPVQKMSGAFIDMALTAGCTIVPVRFVGGLPKDEAAKRLEFPLDMGQQDIYFGAPLTPEYLNSMPYGPRKDVVIQAINQLGPNNADEQPIPGDAAFQAQVDSWVKQTATSPEHAVLWRTLQGTENPCKESQQLIAALQEGQLPNFDGPVGDWLKELALRLSSAHRGKDVI